MALFKVNRGNSASLPSVLTDGWAYFCTDTAEFFIDYADENGELHRKQISAQDAKTLTGMSLEEIQKSISWNQLIDKPVESAGGDTLTWDGNTEGRVSFDGMFYHVSDAVITSDNFKNGVSINFFTDGAVQTYSYSYEEVQEMFQHVKGGILAPEGMLMVAPHDNFNPYGGAVVSKAGIYFAYMGESTYTVSITIPNYTGFTGGEVLVDSIIPNTVSRVGHTHSFNDLEDKPFYETIDGNGSPDTLTWDGNTEGLEAIGGCFYHISDITLTLDNVRNGAIISSSDGSTNNNDYEYLSEVVEFVGIITFGDGQIIVIPVDNWEYAGITFPKKGIYFIKDGDFFPSSLTIPNYTGFANTTIKKLDVKFMPEHTHSFNDLEDRPFYEETATVHGDTLTWDGNMDGLETIASTCLVSNAVITLDDCINGVSYTLREDADDGNPSKFFTYEQLVEGSAQLGGNGAIAFGQVALYIPTDNFEIMGMVVPKAGLYMDEICRSITIHGYTGFVTTETVVKTIDSKFIPSEYVTEIELDAKGYLTELPEHNHSWNELSDKPFYESTTKDTLTWDGNTEGLVTDIDNENIVSETMYHVSENIVTLDDLANGVTFNGVEYTFSDIQNLQADWEVTTTGDVFFVPYDNYSIWGGTIFFPKAGVYVKGHEGVPCTITIHGYNGFEAGLKKLDAKFLPEHTHDGYATLEHTHDGYATVDSPVFTNSISMGRKANTTIGANSVAMGYDITASGDYSFVEGIMTTASGKGSHAEGMMTTASGMYAHAEGQSTHATEITSHAEGWYTFASGKYSHSEGYKTTASGYASHAGGDGTKAITKSMTAIGEYNKYEDISPFAEETLNKVITMDYSNSIYIFDNVTISSSITYSSSYQKNALEISPNDYFYNFDNPAVEIYKCTDVGYDDANERITIYYTKYTIVNPSDRRGKDLFVIGNGTDDTARSNAHTLDWQGNAWFAGDVYVGSTSGTNKDEGSTKLVTEADVDTKLAALVNSAPDKLNTLDELAAALGDDENFANTVTTELSKKANADDLGALATKDSLTASDVGAAELEHTHPIVDTSTGIEYSISVDDGKMTHDIIGEYSELSITSSNRAKIGYTTTTTDLVIPSVFVDTDNTVYKITSIGDKAFSRASRLVNVTIPDSVTSIGETVFSSCSNLTNINIPDGVTSISKSTFTGCKNLTSIALPNNLVSIGDLAFYKCSSLTNINIPNSVTSIGGNAFQGCSSLVSITIPYSVTDIGSVAFGDCTNLVNINIPNTINCINNLVFSGCNSLTNIAIPNSVTSIGRQAFAFCDLLTNISIPDSVTNISDFAFDHSGLISIIIPNSISSIGKGVFQGCASLTSITIPNSVSSIGDYAFSECSALTTVYYSGTEEEWNSITIGDYNDALINANKIFNCKAIEIGAATVDHTHSWNDLEDRPSDEDIVNLLVDMNVIQPLSNTDNAVFVTEDNKIYVL